MRRLLLAALVASAFARPAMAEPGFSCEAKGTGWQVTGSAATKMACQFTCALVGPGDMIDHVSCAATVYPGMPTNIPCEGFMVGKRWSSAELVARQCSQQ